MTDNDLVALSTCVAIFFIFVAILVFVLVDDKKHKSDYPTDDDFEHQVRIVELENGTFSVQQCLLIGTEMARSEFIVVFNSKRAIINGLLT